MYDTRVRVNTKNKIKIEKFDEYYVSNITLQKAGAREATKAASLAPTPTFTYSGCQVYAIIYFIM